jgi:hypothetical protein
LWKLLADDGHGALLHRITDESVAIHTGTRHSDEEITRLHLARIGGDTVDFYIAADSAED